MRAIYLILLLLLISPVASSQFNSYTSVVGLGAYITNNEHQYHSGDNLQNKSPNYMYGASSSGMVTTYGEFGHEAETTLDASTGNKLTSVHESSFDAAVYFDTLAMVDSGEPQPELYCDAGNMNLPPTTEAGNNSTMVSPGQYPYYQYAEGSVAGFSQNGRYKSAKTIVDADYALSTRAYWEGAGLITSNFHGEALAGADKNSTTLNYQNEVREHDTASSNITGGIEFSKDLVWKDFSNPFVQAGEEANTSEEQD